MTGGFISVFAREYPETTSFCDHRDSWPSRLGIGKVFSNAESGSWEERVRVPVPELSSILGN